MNCFAPFALFAASADFPDRLRRDGGYSWVAARSLKTGLLKLEIPDPFQAPNGVL